MLRKFALIVAALAIVGTGAFGVSAAQAQNKPSQKQCYNSQTCVTSCSGAGGKNCERVCQRQASTEEVRANIDNELVDKSIEFMRRQKVAGKPFFLYLPFSMGHVPNLPSQ